MARQSAGLLLYLMRNGYLEVFLVQVGGPFGAKKDAGAWTIPKGEFADEPALDAARRELLEETGFAVGGRPFIPLPAVKQRGGKWVFARAVEADVDPHNCGAIRSRSARGNTRKWTAPTGSRSRKGCGE